jgi:mRNA interferase MazF
VRRGEVHWADLGPPAGRRPVLILTRDAAIPVLSAVVVAPLTRTVRGIRSEVPLGPGEGLPDECVANCDSLLTVPKAVLDLEPVGRLVMGQTVRLDAALRFSLDVRY